MSALSRRINGHSKRRKARRAPPDAIPMFVVVRSWSSPAATLANRLSGLASILVLLAVLRPQWADWLLIGFVGCTGFLAILTLLE